MSAEAILDKIGRKRGWSATTKFELLCEYVDNQNSADALEEFLQREADDVATNERLDWFPLAKALGFEYATGVDCVWPATESIVEFAAPPSGEGAVREGVFLKTTEDGVHLELSFSTHRWKLKLYAISPQGVRRIEWFTVHEMDKINCAVEFFQNTRSWREKRSILDC